MAPSNEKSLVRVLHVDDDPSIREISKQILLDMGNFDIDNACCVDEAFKKLSTGNYDVVISDYEMPKKDGLQFLKELREQKNDIPFVLFTGKGREEVAIEALNLGADRYFNKQGNPETVYGELAHGIMQLVSQNRLSKKLSVEEERFRQLFSNTPMAVAIYEAIDEGEDFVFKDINSAAEKIEKIEKAAVLGKRVTNVFPGVKDFGVFEVFKRVWKTGKAEYFPVALYHDNRDIGSWRENWVIKLPNDNIAAIYNDITERKKNDLEIKQKNEMLERVSESIDSGLALIDKDYSIVWANKHLMDLGVDPNKKCYQTFNNSDSVCPDCGAKKVFEQNVCLDVHEFKTVNSKGETVWIELRVAPLKDKDGNVTAALELAVPITERKKTERALEESEEKYRKLFEEFMDAIFVADAATGIIVDCNNAASKLIGRQKSELVGQHHSIITPQEKMDGEFARVFKQHLKDQSKTLETQIVRKTGEIRDVAVRDSIFELKGKKLMQGTIRDITERKKAEKEIATKQELVQEVVNSSDALIFSVDRNYHYTSFNRAHASVMKAIYGVDIQVGKSLLDYMSVAIDREKAKHNIDKTLGGEKLIEESYSGDDQLSRNYFIISHSPIRNANGEVTGVVVVSNDITERKKAEEAIKFQADLLNHVGQAVIMVDNNRTIRFWNKAAEKLFGWSEEQAWGHKVTELLGGTSPEEADEVSKRLLAGESWSTEVLAKSRDGSVVPVILNRTPIYKEDGEFVGAASITTDITLQKNSEADLSFSLESLSNSLDKIQELNEKLRVVGGLTRHDVRNKLSAVTGYAYLLKKKHGDLADVVDGLSRMEQAVQEIVKIFDFAKMYEQIGAEELTYINVEEKLKEAVALFSGPIPTIINDCHGLTVLADSFLRQLFFNFIDNTRKYGKKTTTIRVYLEKADQDRLKLVYEDDGVGVPLENKQRLFKEGFSTGGSTGFGLFLTKKMIDVYGWTIIEEGEPGKGAKFTITIPKLNKNGKENYQIVP